MGWIQVEADAASAARRKMNQLLGVFFRNIPVSLFIPPISKRNFGLPVRPTASLLGHQPALQSVCLSVYQTFHFQTARFPAGVPVNLLSVCLLPYLQWRQWEGRGDPRYENISIEPGGETILKIGYSNFRSETFFFSSCSGQNAGEILPTFQNTETFSLPNRNLRGIW